MAARLNKAHQEDVRLKIKTSQLVNRLQGYALGEIDDNTKEKIELDAGRIKAIEVLLRKTLPDLSNVSITGDAENPVSVVTEIKLVAAIGNS